VKCNRDLCKVILSIWSWSVLQFTMVFTATKAPRREGMSTVTTNATPGGTCCTPDVVGIIMSIFMQDGPFLVLRMLLIFKYSVFSYTNMFFTCKNTLVCMLLMYRLVVVQVRFNHRILYFTCKCRYFAVTTKFTQRHSLMVIVSCDVLVCVKYLTGSL